MKGILLINASQQDDINSDLNNSSTDTDYLFHQKQKQMQQSLQFEQSMLKERQLSVRQIEENVLDANQIMRELSILINQQTEAVGEYFLLCNSFYIKQIPSRLWQFFSNFLSRQYRAGD